MVPTGWASLLLFVLLIAPGLFFDLLEQRRRASGTESSFREISRVVLSSLVFSVISGLLVTFVAHLYPAWFPSWSSLILADRQFVAAEPRPVATALGAQLALSLTQAFVLHTYLSRRGGGATIRTISTWSLVLRRHTPAGHTPYVRVKTTSGAVYTGRLLSFSPDLEIADRELVLGQPLTSRPAGGLMKNLPDDYQTLVLRGSNIESLAVRYSRLTDPPSSHLILRLLGRVFAQDLEMLKRSRRQ